MTILSPSIRGILCLVVMLTCMLAAQGCQEPELRDREAAQPLVFEFSHCLAPMNVTSEGRGCFDAVLQRTRPEGANGCLVVESPTASAPIAVPVSLTEMGVRFLEPVSVPLQEGQTFQSAVFFYGHESSQPACTSANAPDLEAPCEGDCVLKLTDAGGTLTTESPIRFTTADGVCSVSWNPENAPDEYCDGTDNDCDGVADEGIASGMPEACTVGVGACAREGVFLCGDDGRIGCDAVPGRPRPETADGVDEDCDGNVDEGLMTQCAAPGMTEACSESSGVDERCTQGMRICQDNGEWGPCLDQMGQPLVAEEVCDGLDNDCDGERDEDFGGRGDIFEGAPCVLGTGTCRTEGRWFCGAMELACDAPTQLPEEETCDGEDNDCDGRTDEADRQTPLSQACYSGEPATSEVGACRPGARICTDGAYGPCRGEILPREEVCAPAGEDEDCDGAVDESGQNACGVCGPLPQETCNLQDDDCDGEVDEDFELTEVTSCGSCENDCTAGVLNAEMACVRGMCVVGECEPGFQDRDRDPANGCECNGAAIDEPDPDFIDADCDGLDGTLGDAIFVHPQGRDNEVGSADQPMQTLEAAIQLAQTSVPRFDRIFVAEGSYRLSEFVTINGVRVRFQLPDGLRIHGGFRRAPNGRDWSRHPIDEARTIIFGSQVALRVNSLTRLTMIDNLEIRALDSAAAAPSSSVGILATNVGPHLHLRDVVIRAGRGGDGGDGRDGSDGTEPIPSGAAGGLRGGGAGGGAILCDELDFRAGAGGDGGLPGVSGEAGEISSPDMLAAAGGDTNAPDEDGLNGADGLQGEHGNHGTAGRADGFVNVDDLWQPDVASDGENGLPGGGGGGGAGRVADGDEFCVAGGGGGGTGGCGGVRGTGGRGGFGSFGLIVRGGNVRLESVTIIADDAGSGGDGGRGGDGANGGDGGRGAEAGGACSIDDFAAGEGGDGGDGGCGGHGAGASGGPSIAILRVAPRLGAMPASNATFIGRNGEALPDQNAAAESSLQTGIGGDAGEGGRDDECQGAAPDGSPGVVRLIGCCHTGPGGGPCGAGAREGLTCNAE